MNKKRNILLIFTLLLLSIGVSLAQGNKRYKKHKGPKVKHHAGFFSSNDKATRKNEKFKKKKEYNQEEEGDDILENLNNQNEHEWKWWIIR